MPDKPSQPKRGAKQERLVDRLSTGKRVALALVGIVLGLLLILGGTTFLESEVGRAQREEQHP